VLDEVSQMRRAESAKLIEARSGIPRATFDEAICGKMAGDR